MGPPPVVTGISPKEGPPGTKVTIRGEFLGTSVTDLIGLKICGCDCLLSAEWKSKNKIVARSGPCKGRGDIIVTTKSGGEGTSTVQFRGYHESIGPVKESAVWVEEAAPVSLPWGRRPISPTTYTPPDPLGLSTEGDECKFPEEELHELFPNGSGDLADDNFEPLWYLIEHHSNTSYEDLKAGMVFLQRKVESQKEGQISFLKANTGAVMDQLDRLVLFKNMFEEDQRKNGKEPLPTLQAAIEKSITLADSLFSDILSRKESTDKTREALALLTRHKFLFQLPASIDKNIKRKDFDLVVNDYTRVKNLFGNTDVKLFQKILAEIDQKIDDLKENLVTRIKAMPISIQEQRKYIRLLISLNWDGDAAWIAINSRNEYLIQVMNKIKEHFKQDEKEAKRKAKEWTLGEWSSVRRRCCAAACAASSGQLAALWTLARAYFAGELGGAPAAQDRHLQFKQMILSSVEVLSGVVRWALLSGSGAAPLDVVRAVLTANLHSLREAYDVLIKLDLPSQPLSIVEKVIYDYRVHGMTVFLNKTLKDVKALGEQQTWHVEEYTDYGAITSLPRLVERSVSRCVVVIVQCVWGGGRREGPLDAPPLHALLRHILAAYLAALHHATQLDAADERFSSSCLSEALCVSGSSAGRGPLRRLLLAGANARYSRHVMLDNLAAVFDSNGLPQPKSVFESVSADLSSLESTIAEMYLEYKGDPLVGTIETSMYMGHRLEPDSPVEDARPYLYEIINNLIDVHAEVDSVSGAASGRYMRDIVETVCEEVSRLSAAPAVAAAALHARLEYTLLRVALAPHLTRKAENYLTDAIASLPPLQSEADAKHLEVLIQQFKKRMELQLASLNCNLETV